VKFQYAAPHGLGGAQAPAISARCQVVEQSQARADHDGKHEQGEFVQKAMRQEPTHERGAAQDQHIAMPPAGHVAHLCSPNRPLYSMRSWWKTSSPLPEVPGQGGTPGNCGFHPELDRVDQVHCGNWSESPIESPFRPEMVRRYAGDGPEIAPNYEIPVVMRGVLAITLDRKDVAVGILEPGDLAAAGAG
jgi:hypothetical protein